MFHKLRTDKAFRFRAEKYLWLAMVPITLIRLRNSVVYIALLSVYALFFGASSREEAAEAANAAREANK